MRIAGVQLNGMKLIPAGGKPPRTISQAIAGSPGDPGDIGRIAKIVSTYITQEIRENKLTYGYLGILTGTLRGSSMAWVETESGMKTRVLVGTGTAYGQAYETGNWVGVQQDDNWREKYKNKVRKFGLPEWRGKRKRPFLKDSIEDPHVQARINAKLSQGKPV